MQKNSRIFIVDDDPFWTKILAKILFDLGFSNIATFSNGSDCVDSLHLKPSLIFLDYEMEDINGLEVLKKIQEYPEIGTIFCTAHENLQVAMDAMNLGSYDYLLKSNVSVKEVESIIKGIENK